MPHNARFALLFEHLNFYLKRKPKFALASFDFSHDAVSKGSFNVGQNSFGAMRSRVEEES